MERTDISVARFPDHTQAEVAVKALAQAGFDMKQLSIIGRGYHTEDNVVGFYNAGGRIRFWGKYGAFWGSLWGLFGAGIFVSSPRTGHGAWRSCHDRPLRRRGRGRLWRLQRHRRRDLQHGHSREQRSRIRACFESRFLSGLRPWNGGRRGSREIDPRHGQTNASRCARGRNGAGAPGACRSRGGVTTLDNDSQSRNAIGHAHLRRPCSDPR